MRVQFGRACAFADVLTMRAPQTNEGAWQYALDESDEAVTLDVAIGRFVTPDMIRVDVSPFLVRVLVKGRLLQVHTPQEVTPSAARCQRSATTGALVITMPRATAALASKLRRTGLASGEGAVSTRGIAAGVPQAPDAHDALRVVTTARRAQHTPLFTDGDDPDAPPPLCA